MTTGLPPGRLLPLLLLVLSPALHAAEWRLTPELGVQEEYDDNIRLVAGPHDNAWGTVLKPAVELAMRTEVTTFTGKGRFELGRYSGQRGLDSNDAFLDLSASRKLERGDLGLDASAARDTTLRTGAFNPDTGLVVDKVGRTTYSATLHGSYLLNERTRGELRYQWQSASYDNGERLGLFDYRYRVPSASLVYQYDPQLAFTGSFSHSRLDFTIPTDFVSETNSGDLGAIYQWSERLQLRASAGRRHTRSTRTPFLALFGLQVPIGRVTTSNSGSVYRASANYKYEAGSLDLDASRTATPSSTGTETDDTEFDVTARRRFSPKLSGEVAARYLQTRIVGGTLTVLNSDQDLLLVQPVLRWHFTEHWTLSGHYRYRRVKRRGTGQTATSNAILATLRYQWQPWSVSR